MKNYRADHGYLPKKVLYFSVPVFSVFLGLIGAGILISDNPKESQSREGYFFKNSAVQQRDFPVFSQTYLLPIERVLTPEKKNDWRAIEVSAKSALAIDDLSGKILYEKSFGQRVAIASITKLVTAAVILGLADKNLHTDIAGRNYDLDKEVIINKSAVEAEGDSGALVVGEKIKARDLILIMLIASSNDAAFALAEDVALYSGQNTGVGYFVGLMNEFIRKNSLSDTSFANPAGIDDINNYSTAADVIKLSKIIFRTRPEIFEMSKIPEAKIVSADGKNNHFIKNTNKLIGLLPGIVGGKTGYTDEAGESLLLIVKNPFNNQKIMTVIIGADDRFAETKELVNWIWNSYEWK